MDIFNEEGLIDSEVQDILYELGNAGLGNASITLGKLMGIRLHIGIPDVMPADDDMTAQLEPSDNELGVVMEFQKTMDGHMLFIFKKDFINRVIAVMSPDMPAENGWGCDSGEKMSVVKEFANMICAAYLKVVGQYTGVRLYVRPAGLAMNKGDIYCKNAICVKTDFSIVSENGETIKDVGHVVMLLDEDSIGRLVESLCD